MPEFLERRPQSEGGGLGGADGFFVEIKAAAGRLLGRGDRGGEVVDGREAFLQLEPDAVKLGNNQSITPAEAKALDAIQTQGYQVKFQLLPDVSIGYWNDFKGKFNL